MRRHVLYAIAALVVAWCCLPSLAQAHGRVSLGAMVWRHGTKMQADRATDFDGSDITAAQMARDWDVNGSGVGARLSYEFPRLLTVFGEAGASQATVRDKEVLDPSQPVESRGLDNGGYYGLGLQVGGPLQPRGNTFWSVGGLLSVISTDLDQDVTTRWEYDETRLTADGKVGAWLGQVAFYGGVRVVNSDATLHETDRTNLPGFQVRTTELSRDGPVDLIIGAQTRSHVISGFTELGMVGTFSANVGLNMRF